MKRNSFGIGFHEANEVERETSPKGRTGKSQPYLNRQGLEGNKHSIAHKSRQHLKQDGDKGEIELVMEP